MYLHEGRLLRTVILCPVAVRISWKREFLAHSNIPEEYITVLEGNGQKRIEQMTRAMEKPGIIILNYEAIRTPAIHGKLLKWCAQGIEAIVFDESHKLKNHASKTTKLAIKLADQAQYRYILTGTPILNSPMDIFSQFRVLDGGATFGSNFFSFRAKYFYDKNAGMPSHKHFPDWRPHVGIEDAFNKLIYQKGVRIMKEECLDLPPLVKQEVYCPLGKQQAVLYKEMRDDFITYLEDEACVATLALTKALRLQQIVCGHVVTENSTRPINKNPRLELLRDMVEEYSPDQKIIIWASFRESYKTIGRMLDEVLKLQHIDSYFVPLVGGMTDFDRQTAIDSFQNDPDCRVILANQAAGGTGITLTAASIAIYYSKSFSLEHDLQSEARCHRGGSEIHKKVTRIDIVATNTIDEIINEALRSKASMADRILELRGKL